MSNNTDSLDQKNGIKWDKKVGKRKQKENKAEEEREREKKST